MSKSSKRRPSLAVVSGDGKGAGVPLPSPAGAREFVDDEGLLWRKVRGPLERRLAARMVGTADVMIIGWGAGQDLGHLEPEERAEAWAAVKNSLQVRAIPSFTPYEFATEDGLTLLYIEESC
ncbi:hypothetical protein ACFXKJ_39625 [Kitasatospora indigofera]|uniref:hypothetical protein n=1 Tax=Kitasatospora indigofera TaxID=67307 RepID=UPI0036438DB4